MNNQIGISTKMFVMTDDDSVMSLGELTNKHKIYSLNKDDVLLPHNVCSVKKEEVLTQLYKIEFYNRTHIILAPEQEIIMLDGKKRKANKLHIGEHVMPFSIARKDNKQLPSDSRSYYVIKNIKRLDGDEVCSIETSKKNMVIITITEDDKPNPYGGCFVVG